jgi:hypothetical protein
VCYFCNNGIDFHGFYATWRLSQRYRRGMLQPARRRWKDAMQAFVLVMLVQALILLAVWRWDQHSRRQARQRRHLEIMQTRSGRPAT